MLNKTNVYQDNNWRDKNLMFAYNKTYNYYSYIDGRKYIKTGKVVFNRAYHSCNEGMPSKVGLYILKRNSIIIVKKVIKVSYKETNIVVISTDFDTEAFTDEDKAIDWIDKM